MPSYTQEKNFSKQREKMGTGVPGGIIASEAANNGPTGGAPIPLLSLGIPGDNTTAVPIGAYTINYGVMFDVWTLLAFGVGGYLAGKVGIEVAPLVIRSILGGQAEVYFGNSLEPCDTYTIFFTKSPIALFLCVLIAIAIGYPVRGVVEARRQRRENCGS